MTPGAHSSVDLHPNTSKPFIELMNEVWRCAKAGGHFLSFTPAYPHSAAFCDPDTRELRNRGNVPELIWTTSETWAVICRFKGKFQVVSQGVAWQPFDGCSAQKVA